MISHKFKEFSIQNAKDLLLQLTQQEYLKEMNIGTHFPMIVLSLTEKGRAAVTNHEEIFLDFKKFYTNSFTSAADVSIVDKDILEEYYHIKRELTELQKREEELKDTIKNAMTEKNVNELHFAFMDLYCKKAERVTYPKEKIEQYVSEDILSRIRTVNEIIILTTKIRADKEQADDKNIPVKSSTE